MKRKYIQTSLFYIFFILGIENSALAKVKSKDIFVKVEVTYIYQDASFDAPIIMTAQYGEKLLAIAKRPPFLKVKLKNGSMGYVSDADVTFNKINKTENKTIRSETKRRRKPFDSARYRGLVIENIQFTENTMGSDRTENLTFYGAKFSGYNTLIEGDIFVDSNILFYSGAPKYYSDITGQPASGWIFMGDMLFETALPQSSWHYLYYGFGPIFKYSHFSTALLSSQTGIISNYSMDDMTIGAALNAGIAFRMSQYALRSDVKYIWERTKYLAFGLSFQLEF